jgi:hypothetical protein
MVFEWESPARIIVEYIACWQCPGFRAWRAGTLFPWRTATPYLNPARL